MLLDGRASPCLLGGPISPARNAPLVLSDVGLPPTAAFNQRPYVDSSKSTLVVPACRWHCPAHHPAPKRLSSSPLAALPGPCRRPASPLSDQKCLAVETTDYPPPPSLEFRSSCLPRHCPLGHALLWSSLSSRVPALTFLCPPRLSRGGITQLHAFSCPCVLLSASCLCLSKILPPAFPLETA